MLKRATLLLAAALASAAATAGFPDMPLTHVRRPWRL